MRVPEYFWFDPFHPEDRAGFYLNEGVYQPIDRDDQDRLVSRILGLTLVLWKGVYRGLSGTWLRWATPEGEPLPTDAEAAHTLAAQERQRAEQANQRAEQQSQRAEQAEQERRTAEHERQHADAEMARAERAEQ